MKKCQFAGKKRGKHIVTIKKGKRTIKFKASSGCAPRTKAQRKLAAAAHACKAKGIKPSFRKGTAWTKCMSRAL
jgi:hypothetical protein